MKDLFRERGNKVAYILYNHFAYKFWEVTS